MTTWRGIFKVLEESGELGQLLGKVGAFPDGVHPDNSGPLKERIEDEVADLYAALDYFRRANELDSVKIYTRRQDKRELFESWILSGVQLETPPVADAPATLLRLDRKPGCSCKPGCCMAPAIMGRQMPCLDPTKAEGGGVA